MSEADQSGAGRREVAYRLFAAEYEDADYSYSESDEDRAPNYVITPTGARVNRLFVVGVLTEIEQVSDDVLRGRVVDPTGAFVLYAGQYQPDEQAFLESADPPTFVAVTGKARTFQPDDSDQVYTSVRPESISEVDADTRDRWTVQAAEQTLDRIGHMATATSMDRSGDDLERTLAEQGVDEGLAAGIPLARSHYGTTPTYLDALREIALDAARIVADERDEVSEIDVLPDESGTVTTADLVGQADVSLAPSAAGSEQETSADNTQPAGTSDSDSPKTADSQSTETTELADDTADRAVTDEGTGDEQATDDTVAETTTADEPTAETTTDVSASEEPTTETDADDIGDFEPGEFELEDETREEIEDEYGTEFQTGTEVEEPGAADIETPDVEEAETSEGEPETAEGETGTSEPGPSEQAVETEETTAKAPESESETVAEPDDMQAAVVELMQELDDGSGADREALLAEMADRYGVGEDETEDAIQQALMDGECYEPDDARLKPI